MTKPDKCLQMELEAVRPDGLSHSQQEEEYRLSVALLPLRLRIDQTMVAFLQSFFATSDTSATKEAAANASAQTAVTDPVQESEGTTFTACFISGQLCKQVCFCCHCEGAIFLISDCFVPLLCLTEHTVILLHRSLSFAAES